MSSDSKIIVVSDSSSSNNNADLKMEIDPVEHFPLGESKDEKTYNSEQMLQKVISSSLEIDDNILKEIIKPSRKGKNEKSGKNLEGESIKQTKKHKHTEMLQDQYRFILIAAPPAPSCYCCCHRRKKRVKDSHEFSVAQEQKNIRAKDAFGIRDSFIPGSSLKGRDLPENMPKEGKEIAEMEAAPSIPTTPPKEKSDKEKAKKRKKSHKRSKRSSSSDSAASSDEESHRSSKKRKKEKKSKKSKKSHRHRKDSSSKRNHKHRSSDID